jgi:hypothetical protein
MENWRPTGGGKLGVLSGLSVQTEMLIHFQRRDLKVNLGIADRHSSSQVESSVIGLHKVFKAVSGLRVPPFPTVQFSGQSFTFGARHWG